MSRPFATAHAMHPQWRGGLELVAAQLRAQLASGQCISRATLGVVYFTESYVPHAEALLAALKDSLDVQHWVGCSAVGICSSGVEYFEDGALCVMLTDLADSAQVFSGLAPIKGRPACVLVHADAATPDLADLVEELGERSSSGYSFGGIPSGRASAVAIADGVHRGGLSGLAISDSVALISRVTQGAQPIGRTRVITRAQANVVYELDGEPALTVLFNELGLDEREPRRALPHLRGVLVALTSERSVERVRGNQFGTDTVVRHLVGIDALNRGVAIGAPAKMGELLSYSTRSRAAAEKDLVRLCTQVRAELESGDEGEPAQRIRGAIYVSCAGRGGPHFGAPNAELKLVQKSLGDVPLVGFFAGGEIAHKQLYGYTGVLTCFL